MSGASFDLSFCSTSVIEKLLLAPPPTWPTFRIDARHSVTSVEKVERGIRPGRCADVTLGWRAETGRQVVVGHTRTHAHIHTRTYTGTYTYGRVGRSLAAFRGTNRFRLLSSSLFSPFLSMHVHVGIHTRACATPAARDVADRNFARSIPIVVTLSAPPPLVRSPPGSVSRARGMRFSGTNRGTRARLVRPRRRRVACVRRRGDASSVRVCVACVCVRRACTRASMKRLSPPSCREEV